MRRNSLLEPILLSECRQAGEVWVTVNTKLENTPKEAEAEAENQ